MALPVPTVEQLADFTGREPGSYTAYAESALAQATLLLEIVTGITEMPTDATLSQLAQNAILELADKLTYDQVYSQVIASPFQSETIGSYSYSKGVNFAERAKTGQRLGLLWWDLALERLTGVDTGGAASGSIAVFDRTEITVDTDGNRAVLNPAEADDAGYGSGGSVGGYGAGVGFVNTSQSFRF